LAAITLLRRFHVHRRDAPAKAGACELQGDGAAHEDAAMRHFVAGDVVDVAGGAARVAVRAVEVSDLDAGGPGARTFAAHRMVRMRFPVGEQLGRQHVTVDLRQLAANRFGRCQRGHLLHLQAEAFHHLAHGRVWIGLRRGRRRRAACAGLRNFARGGRLLRFVVTGTACERQRSRHADNQTFG
jgi:hypothetical protein